jgi:hypothetical protein
MPPSLGIEKIVEAASSISCMYNRLKKLRVKKGLLIRLALNTASSMGLTGEK